MAAAGIVDPTKAGRYPVVLSDALLGKKSTDVYTGIRYNHKPDTPPESAKLRQTINSSQYDLTYKDDSSNSFFKYKGNRSTGDDRYVLVFDPEREVFVLHKVDSTFNMNLIQTPENKDAASLKKQYPHLKNSGTKPAPASKAKSGAASQAQKGRKTQKKEEPRPASPKKRTPASDREEESSDDDGGLDIEFPGGKAPGSNRDFSPAFPPRRFSEFVADADQEEDDADGEEDDDDVSEEHFKLPSPMNYQTTTVPVTSQPAANNQTISLSFDDDSASEEDEEPQPQPQDEPEQDDMDIDLEAELEDALAAQSESDVSEED